MFNLSVFELKIFLDTRATCWCIAYNSKRHSTRQPISKRHSTRHLNKCPCRSWPLSSTNILLYYTKTDLIIAFSSSLHRLLHRINYVYVYVNIYNIVQILVALMGCTVYTPDVLASLASHLFPSPCPHPSW